MGGAKGVDSLHHKKKSKNDEKIRQEALLEEEISDNLKENFNIRNSNQRKSGNIDNLYEYGGENKKDRGNTVNSINSDSNENFKLSRNNKKENRGKSVDGSKPVELLNKRKNNEDSESDFIHFTSNNPQTEDSDGKSSRKYFESSREIDFFVSSDCA